MFECIDRALRSLGDSVAISFYYHVESRYGLPKEEFASRPLEFVKYLSEFLGATGSSIIEKLILKEIRSSFNLVQSSRNATLDGAIEEARQTFLAS